MLKLVESVLNLEIVEWYQHLPTSVQLLLNEINVHGQMLKPFKRALIIPNLGVLVYVSAQTIRSTVLSDVNFTRCSRLVKSSL